MLIDNVRRSPLSKACPMYDIGDYTYFSLDMITIVGTGKLKIGKFCSFASDASFVLEGHNLTRFSTYPFSAVAKDWSAARKILGHPHRKSGITIGNDVLVGFRAIICDGATVGDGAVISAGSLVTGNVKPYTIVGGNPAEFMFSRFSEGVIALLMKLRWWDLPIKTIQKIVPVICSSNVDALRRLVEKLRPNKERK